MHETRVWSLGGEDPLEKRMAQFSSVVQSCLKLCDPMDCSTSAFPIHRQLPELTQTHVHQVSDAVQPSHPLSSPSLPAFYLSQHQGLFKWLSSCACFGSTYTKIGTIQRLAWPLRKDDTQIHEAFHIKKKKNKNKNKKKPSSSHQAAKVLEFQLQHQSFQWIFRTDFL